MWRIILEETSRNSANWIESSTTSLSRIPANDDNVSKLMPTMSPYQHLIISFTVRGTFLLRQYAEAGKTKQTGTNIGECKVDSHCGILTKWKRQVDNERFKQQQQHDRPLFATNDWRLADPDDDSRRITALVCKKLHVDETCNTTVSTAS